jgi:hypothetical protein
MVLGESQDCSWVANGWEAMSFFVWFLYASNAALKIVSKSVEVEDVAVEIAWDMVLVEGAGRMLRS